MHGGCRCGVHGLQRGLLPAVGCMACNGVHGLQCGVHWLKRGAWLAVGYSACSGVHGLQWGVKPGAGPLREEGKP